MRLFKFQFSIVSLTLAVALVAAVTAMHFQSHALEAERRRLLTEDEYREAQFQELKGLLPQEYSHFFYFKPGVVLRPHRDHNKGFTCQVSHNAETRLYVHTWTDHEHRIGGVFAPLVHQEQPKRLPRFFEVTVYHSNGWVHIDWDAPTELRSNGRYVMALLDRASDRDTQLVCCLKERVYLDQTAVELFRIITNDGGEHPTIVSYCLASAE